MEIINKNEIGNEYYIENDEGYIDTVIKYMFDESEYIIITIDNQPTITLHAKEIHEYIQRYDDKIRKYIYALSDEKKIATINFKALNIKNYEFYRILNNDKYIELRCYK